MTLTVERREADIPFIDEIWRGSSDAGGSFISGAAVYWELVVTCGHDGAISVTLRGPETHAHRLSYDGGGTWWGTRFSLGSYLSLVSNQHLLNEAISLPVNGDRSFAMNGVDVPLTGYEDAEATVHRLIKVGTLDSDPVVVAAWNGSAPLVSHRSLQRRFRSVTGMSHRTARQIERASEALRLLQQGVSILDTVEELGYSDQAHLTRSLRRWTGQTPAQVVRDRQASTMT